MEQVINLINDAKLKLSRMMRAELIMQIGISGLDWKETTLYTVAIRAKLQTVAASNNRDHPTRSLLFAPHICGVVFRAHHDPVRGESHIQHNANREVATTSAPFYNKPQWLYIIFVKAAPCTTFTMVARSTWTKKAKPLAKICQITSKNVKEAETGQMVVILTFADE